jgi:hypothetical protein
MLLHIVVAPIGISTTLWYSMEDIFFYRKELLFAKVRALLSRGKKFMYAYVHVFYLHSSEENCRGYERQILINKEIKKKYIC